MTQSITSKELLVLQIMESLPSPIYGVDIVKSSDGEIGKPDVYIYLSRLEDKGYVTSYKEEPRPGYRGVQRRCYRVEEGV